MLDQVFDVQFGMNRVVEVFIETYLLVARLVAEIIRNAEVLIVIAEPLKMVNLIRSDPTMQV